jgi:hypothetical protein
MRALESSGLERNCDDWKFRNVILTYEQIKAHLAIFLPPSSSSFGFYSPLAGFSLRIVEV